MEYKHVCVLIYVLHSRCNTLLQFKVNYTVIFIYVFLLLLLLLLLYRILTVTIIDITEKPRPGPSTQLAGQGPQKGQ